MARHAHGVGLFTSHNIATVVRAIADSKGA